MKEGLAMNLPMDYFERVYAGWLAKLIGIRHGAAIEGWTYQKIADVLGEITEYPVKFRTFAADDDSNGPIFFLRALEDCEDPRQLSAKNVADALLNYAPFEHGFFWWGGYGVSTEHTAYLNLRNGIPAPRSGSIAQNGSTMAEQIGGQIFIDTWGLVAPGNPELAAQLAREAASVTHGGNGVYGGVFIAVCISLAFVEKNVKDILNRALAYIPEDCEYARVVHAVMAWHAADRAHSWRGCFEYIRDQFGYSRYPGNCHIIPNAAVMVLALLYGEGRFDDTLNICNMCGWDTDCNVGNVATIMGVMLGLEGIDYAKWIAPINDLLICSGVLGSLNILDVPYCASYIASQGCRLAGEEMPQAWRAALANGLDGCHFEYPGSTHAFRMRAGDGGRDAACSLVNTDERAFSGRRSLKIVAQAFGPACAMPVQPVYVYKKTYYVPDDFDDSRYDPSFSPTVYPGQKLHCAVCAPAFTAPLGARLYAHDIHSDRVLWSERTILTSERWETLEWRIPPQEGALLDEVGVCFEMLAPVCDRRVLVAYLDDFYADGDCDYAIDLAREREMFWTTTHIDVSQFTRLKGHMYLADGQLNLSCADFGEAYTGRHDMRDVHARFTIQPVTGERHFVNFCVQGAIRSYAAGFDGQGRFAIMKNENGYRALAAAPLAWECGRTYEIFVRERNGEIWVECEGVNLYARDVDRPYGYGALGVSVREGSHLRLRRIEVGTLAERD